MTTSHPELEGLDRYKFGWADSDAAGAAARCGLSEEVVRDISAKKNEPERMPDLLLKSLRLFERKPLPDWGADLTSIDFAIIKYLITKRAVAQTGATVPSGLLSLREGARCYEVIRAQFGGYERCHRNAGHEPLPHHVRSRSWSGSWSAGTARLRFGVGCDDGCVFGDEVSRWGGPGEAFTARWKRRPR